MSKKSDEQTAEAIWHAKERLRAACYTIARHPEATERVRMIAQSALKEVEDDHVHT